MLIKNLSIIIMVSLLLLSGCATKDNTPPKIIETNPQNGANDVDPGLTNIWVKFNKSMQDGNWSWCYEDKNLFPQMTGQPYYTEDNTKCILPVKLEPNKEYVIWMNMGKFMNFKDKDGTPVEPKRLTFKTK